MSNINLTDKQRAVLSAATRTAALTAWPLPKKLGLSAGSAAIVIRGLLQKGLLEKRPALGADPVWKEEGGKRLTLVISRTGLAACGIAVEPTKKGAVGARREAAVDVPQDEARRPRPNSKLATVIELLSQEQGTSLGELADATGWQIHTIRGTMSGALKKRFGLAITSEHIDGRGRIYRAARKR